MTSTADIAPQINIDSFLAVDIRAGTILEAVPFPEARKPAYKLILDFGPDIGVKQSSAQITTLYTPADLAGRQVVAVVNLPPRRVAGFSSEVLVLGLYTGEGAVTLLAPGQTVANGARVC